jgi:hypothetical protein
MQIPTESVRFLQSSLVCQPQVPLTALPLQGLPVLQVVFALVFPDFLEFIGLQLRLKLLFALQSLFVAGVVLPLVGSSRLLIGFVVRFFLAHGSGLCTLPSNLSS